MDHGVLEPPEPRQVSRFAAGSIVIVDWRGGAFPGEPTKLRRGIIVEADDRFAEEEPTTLVVPLTTDASSHPVFSLRIELTADNGAIAASWALARRMNTVSVRRARPTPSRITDDQLRQIRQRIALAIGVV